MTYTKSCSLCTFYFKLKTLDEDTIEVYSSMFGEFETWSKSLLIEMMDESDVNSKTVKHIL